MVTHWKEKDMKILTILVLALGLQFGVVATSFAKDFDWLDDLNVEAQLDPSGFRGRLSGRFKIGDAEISAVLSNVENPADAYMVFKLGEMSNRPTEIVIEEYRTNKGRGWGRLAKSLGIKPGSREFHALKRGHDLNGKKKGKDKSRGKNRGRGKGKNKDRW